ncbi:MAG TPA: hypothetical protein VGI85_08380 [Chthoniobacterales bacterium]|jgi:hypothetical protein
MANGSVIVLWLTPAEPARTWFREKIRWLALERDAPIFEPHLTLGLGSVALLQGVEAASIRLSILGVDYSEKFTKTLFVRFELTAALAQLRVSLGIKSAGFDPHLSLLYQHLPAASKRQLAISLSVPFASVTFAAIEAIRCPRKVVSDTDVESWETIAFRPLA